MPVSQYFHIRTITEVTLASTQKLCYHEHMTIFPTRETISDHVSGRNEKVITFVILLTALFIFVRTQPHPFHHEAGMDLTSHEDAELYRQLSSPRTQADVEQMRAIMSRQITVDPYGGKGPQ